MADSTTSNLGLVKIEIASSRDSWGTKVNNDYDIIDAVFKGDGAGTSVGLHVGSGKVFDGADGTVKLGSSQWFIDGDSVEASADDINLLAGVGNDASALAKKLLPYIYPIGSMYYNASVATNPATLLGFGTWELYGSGRVPVCYAASDTMFGTLGATGGSKDAVVPSHTHTATSLATVTDPGHYHSLSNNLRPPGGYAAGGTTIEMQGSGPQSGNTNTQTTGVSVSVTTTNSTEGVSTTGANVQPYVVVYCWRRTL